MVTMQSGMGAMVQKLVVCTGVLMATAHGVLAQTLIKIDGSSTVQPISAAVAEEFENANRGVKVEVGNSGTGGGFKKFLRGEIDISNASRPIQASEMEQAVKAGIEYIELPIAFDALTVMVHPSNRNVDSITVEELKKLWEPAAKGVVTKWSDVRAGWPEEPIRLYGAGTDSGTFEYFTEAIMGKKGASRSDYTASENDNTLVQGISTDKQSLGYFGYSYYIQNKDKLKALSIVSPLTGKPVSPSPEHVVDGSYTPLSRPLFIYVNRKSMQKPEVRKFVEFYFQHAKDLVAEVGYVPLPDTAYALALARAQQQKIGTAFGGHSPVGLHIDEILSRPLSTEVTPKSHDAAPAKEPK